MGDIPKFYATPAGLASTPATRVRTTPVENVGSTIGGWAIDPQTGASATRVFAVANGKVVATSSTGIDRPDVVAALHDPSAASSGFIIRIPKAVDGPVALYGLNANGSVTLLQRDRQTVPPTAVGGHPEGSVVTVSGVAHLLADTRAAGWADSYQKADQEILRLDFPPATSLASYRWLQMRSTSSLGNSSTFSPTM